MSNKESLEDIGRFLASELDALPEKTAIRLVGPKDERAASDADLELAIDKIRKMNVGEITEVLITKSPSSGIAAELAYFVRLNRREELLKRAFADPVVQSQLRDGLLARKSENNKARVTAALIDRAIVVPRSMLAQ